MAGTGWFGRFLRHWTAELLGFSPLVATYVALAACGRCFDQFERDWLIMFQFMIFETFACVITASAAFKLGEGFVIGSGASRRLLSPRERDACLLLVGLVLVGLMPGALFIWSGEQTWALGMASLFLPRMIELWRVREQPRPIARALGYSALSGPLLILGFIVIVMLLGAAAPAGGSDDVSSGARSAGVLVAIYYFTVATVTAWMRMRVEAWQT